MRNGAGRGLWVFYQRANHPPLRGSRLIHRLIHSKGARGPAWRESGLFPRPPSFQDQFWIPQLLGLGVPSPPLLATRREPREVLEPAWDLWIPPPPQSRTGNCRSCPRCPARMCPPVGHRPLRTHSWGAAANPSWVTQSLCVAGAERVGGGGEREARGSEKSL